MPNHRVGSRRIMALGSGKEVIAAAGEFHLLMTKSLCGGGHTAQQEHDLAELRRGQFADGNGSATTDRKRIEHVLGHPGMPKAHDVSIVAHPALSSAWDLARLWT